MRKRSNIIVLYLNDQEKYEYDEAVVSSGLTKQVYGLKALLGKEIKPRPCEHHPALLKTLSDISNDTDQILLSLRANSKLADQEIALLKAQLNLCWQEIHDKY